MAIFLNILPTTCSHKSNAMTSCLSSVLDLISVCCFQTFQHLILCITSNLSSVRSSELGTTSALALCIPDFIFILFFFNHLDYSCIFELRSYQSHSIIFFYLFFIFFIYRRLHFYVHQRFYVS